MPNVCAQVTQRCVTRDKSMEAGDMRQKSIKTRSSKTTHCHLIGVYLPVSTASKDKINLSIARVSFSFFSSSLIRFLVIFLHRVFLHRALLHRINSLSKLDTLLYFNYTIVFCSFQNGLKTEQHTFVFQFYFIHSKFFKSNAAYPVTTLSS